MGKFDDLLKEITADPEKVKSLSKDDMKEVRKIIAKKTYGVIESAGEAKYTALNITNLEDKFQRQLLITGLVSFLYRMSEEYNPENHPSPIANTEEYLAALNYEQEMQAKHVKMLTHYEKEAQMAASTLDHNEKEIKAIGTATPKAIAQANTINHENAKVRNLLSEAISNIKKMEILVNGSKKKVEGVIKRNANNHVRDFIEYYFQYDPELHVRSGTDNRFEISEKIPDIPQHVIREPVKPLTVKRKGELYLPNPPKELFLNFNTYITTNYNSLYGTTYALYHEKPALEYIVNVFKGGMTHDEMIDFKEKNSDTLPVQVQFLKENQKAFLGPFTKNRKHLEYYNEHTELLKAIYDKMEDDEQISKEVLERRVEIEKKRSVADVGEDDPTFLKYKDKYKDDKEAAIYITKGGEVLEEREIQHLPIHVATKDGFTTKEIQLRAEKPEKGSATGIKATGGGGKTQVMDSRDVPSAAVSK